ncbi:MAG TPA: alpha/beta fold hydrolase, partial [Thermoanaerobaculia bacterium]|nr:alpha/beta fold hydrolase [Thermoanaerobaculia bacterium]
DLVGFGRNRRFIGASSLPLPFDDEAVLLARYLGARFSGRPVHLIGHSMGGQIAIHLAASRPDLIRSLVLVSSTGLPFGTDPLVHLEGAKMPPAGLLSFSRVLAADFLRAGPTSVAVAATRLLRDDARALLGTLRLPTLLIWGDFDPLVPARYARQMQQLIPGSRLVFVPHAGHIAMWENAERFNDEVLAFLREVDSSAETIGTREPLFTWGVRDCLEGLCYRQSGPRPTVVLVHGLGVSSSYFRPLARELYARGIQAVAPDLPGYGFSLTETVAPERDAARLTKWSEAAGLKSVVWIGHSTGCQVVDQIAQMSRETRAVFLSPVWSDSRRGFFSLMWDLMRDGVREAPSLLALVIRDYWQDGLARVWRSARRYLSLHRPVSDLRSHAVIVGSEDPLIDWAFLEKTAARVVRLRGAHAFLYSHATELAEAIVWELERS